MYLLSKIENARDRNILIRLLIFKLWNFKASSRPLDRALYLITLNACKIINKIKTSVLVLIKALL